MVDILGFTVWNFIRQFLFSMWSGMQPLLPVPKYTSSGVGGFFAHSEVGWLTCVGGSLPSDELGSNFSSIHWQFCQQGTAPACVKQPGLHCIIPVTAAWACDGERWLQGQRRQPWAPLGVVAALWEGQLLLLPIFSRSGEVSLVFFPQLFSLECARNVERLLKKVRFSDKYS